MPPVRHPTEEPPADGEPPADPSPASDPSPRPGDGQKGLDLEGVPAAIGYLLAMLAFLALIIALVAGLLPAPYEIIVDPI